MAKSYTTLIRLRQRELDELRRRMVIMQENRQLLLDQSEELQAALEVEVKLAAELADMGNFFGNYSEHIKKQRQQLAGQVIKLDNKIERLQLDIAESFGEMKKYELAYQAFLKREKAKAKKREEAQMDEVATRQFIDRMRANPS